MSNIGFIGRRDELARLRRYLDDVRSDGQGRLRAADAPMIAVSRSGGRADGLTATLGPEDLLSAWRTHAPGEREASR